MHSGDSSTTLGQSCLNFLVGPLPDTCPGLPGSDVSRWHRNLSPLNLRMFLTIVHPTLATQPLFNYMNYVDEDSCHAARGEFTCVRKCGFCLVFTYSPSHSHPNQQNQIERMNLHWFLFRDPVTICEDPAEVEIEMTFVIDSQYVRIRRL
jgi:hypothetical protein